MAALEGQASQLGQQASQECDRLAKDRNLTLQMLHKVTLQYSISGPAATTIYTLLVITLFFVIEPVIPMEPL